ncbi:MAG: hypothetical protein HFJ75_07330 [Eggerthellaceae bacterium]|nr:hypothetical protein [Eggerthellaceae bacterium]
MGSYSDDRRGRDSRSRAPRGDGRDPSAGRRTGRPSADGRGRPSASRAPQRRPRQRVAEPLSSQESYDSMRRSRASYERARASRDALAEARAAAPDREVIDGRGSIDSRTFNESHQISSLSHDERDRPRAAIDASMTEGRWHSRAGQGFDAVPDAGALGTLPGRVRAHRPPSGVGFSGGVVSGRGDYAGTGGGFLSGVPLFFKVTVPIIVVLVIVLLFLLLT